MCCDTSSLRDLLEIFVGRETIGFLPEIQVIHRALLIPHIDVERKEVDWSESSAAQDFKESRKAIARLRIDKVVVRHVGSVLKVGNGGMTSTENSKRRKGAKEGKVR
jgi:hypothetical protein